MDGSLTDFAKLWDYSVGFYGVWVAHIGRQMQLFHRIASKPISLEELIRISKLYPPAVRSWCYAALAYRFIIIKRGKLHLKNRMKHMLIDTPNENYLGGQFSYLALRSLEYSAFEELFKFGRTTKMANSVDAMQQATDWDHYSFIALARKNKKLNGLLSRGCRVLDVGCGTGRMISKIQREYSKTTLVGIDVSRKALSWARKIVGGNNSTLVRKSGESMEFLDEFEIVILCETLYATKDKQRVIANCWRALRDHGILLIIEGFLPDSKYDYGASQLIMGMQLDFALQGQEFMKKNDILLLLKDNNFSRIRFEHLGGNDYLVTATKK